MTLALGSRYTTDCVGEDFAGVGSPEDVVVAASDDFGVLTDGGFEGGSTDGVRGGEIVETYGVEAIEGQYMLHAAPGEPVAFHLQRAADEQSLVFDARVLDGCPAGWGYGTLVIEVAVVGGDTIESAAIGMGDTPTEVTVDELGIQVGELLQTVISLPGEGPDVLVQFEGEDYFGAGCDRSGVLMDNVRLE